MPTTNYSLPTLESTALFDLVTDYNALANATDSALARVAGIVPTETISEMQGQISALQTLTGSQDSQITTLQSQMSTANGNISTLQSGLQTANNNIGVLQTGQQGINSQLENINTSFKNYSTFSSKYYRGTNIHSGAMTSSILYVMKNVGETIIKIFGFININGTQPKVVVPGTAFTDGSTVYGIKTNIKVLDKAITTGYLIQCAAIASSTATSYDNCPTYAIGNDGYLYVAIKGNDKAEDPDPTLFLQVPIFSGSPIAVVNQNA